MPADCFTAAQLLTLRQLIQADVSEAVHDDALRGRLLQIIEARFQTTSHGQSAVEQASGQHESEESCDTAPPSVTEQQQPPEDDTAESATQPSTEASNTRSSKRKKKAAAQRVDSGRSAESSSSCSSGDQQRQQSEPQSPPLPQLTQSTPSPSAARDVDLLPATNVSVRLDHNEQSGRLVRAVAPLVAGTRVLDDRGYAAVVKMERCREVCALCHSLIEQASNGQSKPLSCSDCRVPHYCSARCQRIDASYRHPTECRMLAAVGQLSGSVMVDADLLQILAAVCARHYRERHRDQYPCSSGEVAVGSQPTSVASSSVVDEQVEAARWRDDGLTLSHVLDLVYHDTLFTPAWHQSVLSACRTLISFSPDPTLMDGDTLLAVAKRINCNSHAIICPSPSAVVGLGLYCRVSLLNHSCQPNCHYQATSYGRMTVHTNTAIDEGAELTVHYCDLYDSREERQRQLLREKGFVCQCVRCSVDIGRSVDRLVAGVYCTCERQNQQKVKGDSGSAFKSDDNAGVKWSRDDVSAEMAVRAGAPLIVWKGDVRRAEDEQRKDYRCLACNKKYSQAAVNGLLQPLLALHQKATQHRTAGRPQAAFERLEELVALNRQQLICAPHHTLMLSSYVLLCNLARHVAHITASIRYARLVCACYSAVFPPSFMETADWRYLERLQLDKLIKEWRSKPRQDSKPVKTVIRRLEEERRQAHKDYTDILCVCIGQQATDSSTSSGIR